MQITKKRFFLPKEEKQQEVKTEPGTHEDSLFVQDEDEEEDKKANIKQTQDSSLANSTISLEKFTKDLQAIVGQISPIILHYLYDKYSSHSSSVKHATHELFTNPPDVMVQRVWSCHYAHLQQVAYHPYVHRSTCWQRALPPTHPRH